MFPNLDYGMALRGLLNYQLAEKAGVEESRLSRCKRGRLAFTPQERARIASTLGFDESWVFAQPIPPRPRAANQVTAMAAAVPAEVR